MNAYRLGAAALALVLGMLGVAAFSPAPVAAQAKVPVKVTVTVGERTETLRGTGQCGYERQAYIYDTKASLWMADYGEGSWQVTLSYWRPVTGDAVDQFTLLVLRDSTTHRISTVRGGELEGSGQSEFQPTAQGGRFEIKGKDQAGAPLSAIIECARFGPIAAVGG